MKSLEIISKNTDKTAIETGEAFLLVKANDKEYKLLCNFNVVCAIESMCGSILDALAETASVSARNFLACMLNEAAEIQGANERFTPADVGRMMPTDLSKATNIVTEVTNFLLRSIMPGVEIEGQEEETTGKK